MGTFRFTVPEISPALDYQHKAGEPASVGLSAMLMLAQGKVHGCRATPTTSDRVMVV